MQGSVTLVSNRPLTSRELLNSFEAALRLAGAALIQTDGSYKIVALQEVLEGEMGQADLGTDVSAGYGVSAIPLRYISPATLMELLDSFIARARLGAGVQGRQPHPDPRPGGGAQVAGRCRPVLRRRLDEDADRQHRHSRERPRGRRGEPSSRPCSRRTPPPPAPNALKVIPVPRINGLIVIANSQEKVRRAIIWIKRLDQESITDPNYYVYAVQNGNAVELARILQATFGEAVPMPAPRRKWRPTGRRWTSP